MLTSTYGKVSWLEALKAFAVLLPLPLVTIGCLLISPFSPYDKRKTWKRVMTDASIRYTTSSLSINQIQYAMGTTLGVCQKWARSNSIKLDVDEIGDEARLIWFGERKTEKVILYIHGGTYIFPIQGYALSFWTYIRSELRRERNQDIGFVALNYSLFPTATFPTPLVQATAAIKHLISQNIDPSNIILAGDSAGAGLILQIISHILHPHPSVPPLILPSNTKFRGAYLLSPWVSLTGDTGSHAENSASDIVPKETWAYLGSHVLSSITDADRPYIEAVKAPVEWFDGIGGVVGRVLISVGEKECLRDDAVDLANGLRKVPGVGQNVVVVVQQGGVHNDPCLDFLAGEKKLGSLTPVVVGWLGDVFSDPVA
ncbi:Alpha/Beta hydrolase protein [Crucibulum laeve]|uniref:Alpha/Beta hydrolase protein n=1 Tax=Crucibulum laeve TaxID=68775 RepID=A0A5C3M4T5_9AGAR|nr:Alpha/Beta hydrolase protein [Crucibulum laeve]